MHRFGAKMRLLIFGSILLIALSGCATYTVTALDGERHVLFPSKPDFLIKTGGRTQVGGSEYLVIGKMELDNKTYSVIRLPHDLDGYILCCLVSDEGEIYPRFVAPISPDKGLTKAEFIIVPMHKAKVIPDDVRFLPKVKQ